MTSENKLHEPTIQKEEVRMIPENKLHESANPKEMFNWTGFSSKTLWDWLLFLAVLATPIVLILGLAWMSTQANQTVLTIGQVLAQQRYQVDLQLGKQQQQDATMNVYLDRMTALLLNNNLSHSRPSDEVREVARDQTLAVLLRLDSVDRGVIVQFLYQAGLIMKDDVKVSLSGADLRGANLRGANLAGADLSGANLGRADLTNADLTGTLLIGTNLARATMPNGTTNP